MRALMAISFALVTSMSPVAFAQQNTVPTCAQGQVYDPNARRCITPSATQDLTGFYIGGVLILGGVIGAIVLANDGDKTVSP
jgi:hypothetical protein